MAQRLFVVLMVATFAVSLALKSANELTLITLLEMLLMALLVGMIAAWFFAEDKRARSVEISNDGVSALTWNRLFQVIPFRLTPILIRWSEVKRIGQSGFVVTLDDGQKQISINTYLFEQPAEVVSFINECSTSEVKSSSPIGLE
jgi:hypothetical protein